MLLKNNCVKEFTFEAKDNYKGSAKSYERYDPLIA